MKKSGHFAVFFGTIALVGCGASAPPAQSASPNPSAARGGGEGPASTESASAAPASRAERDDNAEELAHEKSKKDAEKEPAPAAAKGMAAVDDLVAAQRAWNDAKKLIFADTIGGKQCEQMCKALESMRRATGRICELVGASSDAYKCTEAKAKLVEAESKVKSTCGACNSSP